MNNCSMYAGVQCTQVFNSAGSTVHTYVHTYIHTYPIIMYMEVATNILEFTFSVILRRSHD